MRAPVRFPRGNARAGFRITTFDGRTRGDNSKPRMARVVPVARLRMVTPRAQQRAHP